MNRWNGRVAVGVLAVSSLMDPLAAQVRMEVRDSATAEASIPELGAIFETDAELRAARAQLLLPAAERSERYREIDLAEGDVVLAVNGRRTQSAPELAAAYAAIGVGEEVALALQRSGRRWIERFEKAAPGASPAGRRATVRLEGNPEDFAMLMGLGVVVQRREGRLVVANVLPRQGADELFVAGDVLLAVNGAEVDAPAALQEAWDGLATGSAVEFRIERDGQARTLTATRPDTSQMHRQIRR